MPKFIDTNSTRHIVISTGGTGGHVFPATVLFHELSIHYKVILLSDERGAAYIQDCPYQVIAVKLKTNNIFNIIKSLFNITHNTIKVLRMFIQKKPWVVIGFGSYVTIPALAAAFFLRIPIILHEQNQILGKTNKLFAPFAKKIALALSQNISDSRFDKKSVYTGNFIRTDISSVSYKYSDALNDVDSEEELRKRNFTSLELNESPFTIVAIGGSQGAAIFAQIISRALLLTKKQIGYACDLHIIQQAKKDQIADLEAFYKENNIRHEISDFFYDMNRVYAQADLVVARGGASTISELYACCIPAILVPLPSSASNHQMHNARYFAHIGGGWCLEEKRFTPETLAYYLQLFISERHRLFHASWFLERKKRDEKVVSMLDIAKAL
ncbi:UDP-N-acetylglucosamine--N-acetylmuramyl-(pentapeptide) pyrophosphoryl-undecaprenol N-acetylglucosamine transferase [Rickettsiales endosymbiont of Paramecium tredecaurelia]|uniref:undecaprenyldiphospho-muramoylpentapeptide beta-N-acetylglucosaminyltransferase n=1 Tax=Candidatus Sarmatiella mevalonica TaxID=2770581 RepID=UPI001920EBA3|nr:undecaprenyldiphospho-muramoylpentapeptide beta-N-acetylglucosaminyltransferase [Candidatus Sarmatiella mevalonica]MBL3284706.1 UDP-N-acetylglucosamine--N-acetylmuramyl-(pentapeptide) pyrophosphoryl-undecaprenol N-acetylglucosamine transferase [Candidatus Sarmatiella mevalonica]